MTNKLNIVVFGLWHLGTVTAACCSKYHNVIGFDFNEKVINDLNLNISPLFEPKLDETIKQGLDSGNLRFTYDINEIKNADVLWITYDTPVDENDISDVEYVKHNLHKITSYLPDNCIIIISSQLPVGTCAELESQYPKFNFVVIPENLRLGKSIDNFETPERIVIGYRNESLKQKLNELLRPFCKNLLYMKIESAEMVKHSINSFLALSITFINEIACLCEHVGADAEEVSIGLKSDDRIGNKAYLKPGGPFEGGTLARDVVNLTNLNFDGLTPLISSIKVSNDNHKKWVINKLNAIFDSIEDKTVLILGLSYKSNTNTLRRSGAIELYDYLTNNNVNVSVYDPLINNLPEEYIRIKLVNEPIKSDIVIIYTDRNEYKNIDWNELYSDSIIIDPNGYLKSKLKNLKYFSIGFK